MLQTFSPALPGRSLFFFQVEFWNRCWLRPSSDPSSILDTDLTANGNIQSCWGGNSSREVLGSSYSSNLSPTLGFPSYGIWLYIRGNHTYTLYTPQKLRLGSLIWGQALFLTGLRSLTLRLLFPVLHSTLVHLGSPLSEPLHFWGSRKNTQHTWAGVGVCELLG